MKRLALAALMAACGPVQEARRPEPAAVARAFLLALCASLPPDPQGWAAVVEVACRVALPSPPAAATVSTNG